MKSNSQYKYVGLKEAKCNPEYWQIMQNMFHEQAARIIQRKWRIYKKITFKGKYSETLNGPLNLHFIQEPWGTKSSEHAKKIKSGQWLALDYKDPEFTRNIFKVLRLKKITLNEMVTAKLLYDAQIAFKIADPKEIKQYKFIEEKSHEIVNTIIGKDIKEPVYSPSSIAYAKPNQIKGFYKNLNSLSEGDQNYFIINFSRKQALILIYQILHDHHMKGYLNITGIDFNSILKTFIASLEIDASIKLSLSKKVEKIISQVKDSSTALYELIIFIYEHEKEYHLESETFQTVEEIKDVSSIKFIARGIRTGEYMPSVIISPDYDANKKNSPLLSLILPTTASTIELLKAFHGNDVSLPYFTVGKFGPSLIRDADENPKKLNLPVPSRPVEITHPDVKPNDKPHGYTVYDFMLTWHDFLFHCWRNSTIPKELIRYIRTVLSNEKHFYMSKPIWSLTDLDFQYGRLLKIAEKNNSIKDYQQNFEYFIDYVLEISAIGFAGRDMYDHNLILLFDMMLFPDTWQQFLGKHPEDFFSYQYMKENFNEMKKIIALDPARSPYQSKIYYILAYRLRSLPNGIQLCSILDKEIGLENFVTWDRNGGLVFQSYFSQTVKTHIRIESLQPKYLYDTLILAFNELSKLKKISSKKAEHVEELINPRINPKYIFGFFTATTAVYVATKLVSGLVKSLSR